MRKGGVGRKDGVKMRGKTETLTTQNPKSSALQVIRAAGKETV